MYVRTQRVLAVGVSAVQNCEKSTRHPHCRSQALRQQGSWWLWIHGNKLKKGKNNNGKDQRKGIKGVRERT